MATSAPLAPPAAFVEEIPTGVSDRSTVGTPGPEMDDVKRLAHRPHFTAWTGFCLFGLILAEALSSLH